MNQKRFWVVGLCLGLLWAALPIGLAGAQSV